MKLPFENNRAQHSEAALDETLLAARACMHCVDVLPLGPRPVLRASVTSRLLIVGQAPGTRVHETGIPWNDPSGDRLRLWMGLDRDTFYDESRIAIIPMGLCYPGRDAHGGDAPPCRACAPLWHPRLVPLLPRLELILLVGGYSQAHYLGKRVGANLTETVRNWRAYLPDYLPLPHPSFRNNAWLKRNPWFDDEVLPYLRDRVAELVKIIP